VPMQIEHSVMSLFFYWSMDLGTEVSRRLQQAAFCLLAALFYCAVGFCDGLLFLADLNCFPFSVLIGVDFCPDFSDTFSSLLSQLSNSTSVFTPVNLVFRSAGAISALGLFVCVALRVLLGGR
jgi:hypothetical protein